jgi:hypothetical protein
MNWRILDDKLRSDAHASVYTPLRHPTKQALRGPRSALRQLADFIPGCTHPWQPVHKRLTGRTGKEINMKGQPHE